LQCVWMWFLQGLLVKWKRKEYLKGNTFIIKRRSHIHICIYIYMYMMGGRLTVCHPSYLWEKEMIVGIK